MSILIAESLEKKYRSRKVVNNLSFNIKSGEIIGLLGPNGAGKTTAFYMTVGLVSCTSGKIILDDQDITSFPRVFISSFSEIIKFGSSGE